MELWQKLGYASYRAWRCAYDAQRRKRLKAAKLAAAAPALAQWQPTQPPGPAASQPALPVLAPAPLSAAPSREPPSPTKVPQCKVREEVQVTPRGRRQHHLEVESPGGTTRVDEYSSPAGAQPTGAQQDREACFQRLAAARRAAKRVAAAERAEAQRVEAQAAALQGEAQPRTRAALAACLDEDRRRRRRSRDALCGDCEPCRVRMTCPVVWPRGTPAAKRKRLGSTYAPCEERLTRMGYRRSELETVYDLLCCDSHPDFPEYLPHDGRQLYHSW